MALPKKFKLINYDWAINIVPQSEINIMMADQGSFDTYGAYCSKARKEIAISELAPPQERPRSVLHECLHACFHRDYTFSQEQEEKIVCLLEERLTDLIKNNPKLIKYFQENL